MDESFSAPSFKQKHSDEDVYIPDVSVVSVVISKATILQL